MGLYATSVKQYAIEYGDTRGFNYDPDTLEDIIRKYCDDIYLGEGNSGLSSTSAIWEIDKDEFREMINLIENLPQRDFEDSISHRNKSYDKDYVVSLLKGFLKDTPNNSNHVRIAWV